MDMRAKNWKVSDVFSGFRCEILGASNLRKSSLQWNWLILTENECVNTTLLQVNLQLNMHQCIYIGEGLWVQKNYLTSQCLVYTEPAKLRALRAKNVLRCHSALTCLRAHVLMCLVGSRALVLTCPAYSRGNVPCMLTCSRANVFCVFTCSRANVLCVLTCSRANLTCMHTCSCANVLYVLTFQRASSAYVPHVSTYRAC